MQYNTIVVLSFNDSPRKPLLRRPLEYCSLGVLGHLAAGLKSGARGRRGGASPAGEEVAVGGVHFREVVEIGEDDGQLDEAPVGRSTVGRLMHFQIDFRGGVKGRKGGNAYTTQQLANIIKADPHPPAPGTGTYPILDN